MREADNFGSELENYIGVLSEKYDKVRRRPSITAEMAFLAAQLIADCPPERKPAVMYVLELGGFKVSKIRQAEEDAVKKAKVVHTSVIGDMLRDARDNYDASITDIANESGVNRVLLYKYMNGTYSPSVKTAKKVIEAVNMVVPMMSTDKYIEL